VLDAVAERGEWGRAKPGHALGIAAFEAFGSYIGSVVDVTVKDKAITLHKVVTAIDCGVAVHGYCQSGMILTAAALLKRKPHPTMTNICRCGTYDRARKAIHRAAGG
jgi:isoquinoline 1-oxidoreductase alpha subunit